MVTAHVLISYEGDAFAWVLPVPGELEVFPSSQQLFATLAAATAPTALMSRTETGCYAGSPDAGDADADADTDTDTDADADLELPPAVTVVSRQTVGPYDSVVLRADDAVALVDWLQANAYDVPDSFARAVLPYVAPGMSFLALKLAKDNDAGDIEPIGLRYPGDRPSIPLSLTAIAATADMPVTVYLVGAGRGVPLSWLHVDLNPLGWDWFGDGLDLPHRLAQAADEAGGSAFMTAFAGPNAVRVGAPSTAGLSEITSALGWFQALPQGFTDDPALLPELLPAPDGVGLPFYDRPEDYPAERAQLDDGFDPVLATAALEERIVGPREAADELLSSGAWLTRLDAAVSPEEMAVDPLFGFNADLPAVERLRIARLATTCRQGEGRSAGARELDLPGGPTLPLPAEADLPPGVSTSTWIEQHILHDALVVTQFSESGDGEVLADHSDELAWELPPSGDEAGGGAEPAAACGCQACTEAPRRCSASSCSSAGGAPPDRA